LTDNYNEMLTNPNKKIITLGIQNDANVNLDKNVVIGLDGKRINEG